MDPESLSAPTGIRKKPGLSANPKTLVSVALPTEGDTLSTFPSFATSSFTCSRARGRIFPEHQSLSLKARSEGWPHRKQEMTFSASKERRAGGCPGCRSTGLSPAQRWLPPHRSHRATLEDGAGCICSPTGRRSWNIPSRWAPSSISSKSPQSPSFEPRCHGPRGPFSYEGRKNGGKNQRSGSRRRPGRCRSLEVLPSRSRPWWRPWDWTNPIR